MTSPTGKKVKRPKPEEWSFQITVTFMQVPDDKREAFQVTLAWFAREIEKELTALKAEEAVSG
jgi:hypothetical protein